LRNRLPIARWGDLAARIPKDRLENFDDGKAADIVVSGLDYNGTLYLKACNTVAGPLPWCERSRFGVWSATKALVTETALLRLAQKYGPGVLEERMAAFLPQVAVFPGWADVRFADAGGLENYSPWYEAHTKEQKIHAALVGSQPFPWGPGQVARYRDQDIFMLVVAMDNYIKKKEGKAASIWTMLSKEVFEPIGIHAAPINETLELAGRQGQPLMAFGYYPTVSDIVGIARLYQNFGAYHARQLLYSPTIERIFSRTSAPGLPTGKHTPFGEIFYFNTFWKAPYSTRQGCKLYYPQMEGWGGTVVALMPGKLTGIRIAKIWDDGTNDASATDGMASVAEQLESFVSDSTC